MNTKLTFIAAHAHDHAIRLLCRVLDVSRSWFHAWQRTAAERAERAARFEVLVDEIRAIFEDSKQRYGAPRIHAELQAQGHHVSRKTVANLMKLRGIHPPRRKRRMPVTTDSRHSFAIAPNLLNRNFKIMAPDTVWLADISYIPPPSHRLLCKRLPGSGRGLALSRGGQGLGHHGDRRVVDVRATQKHSV